MTMEPEMTGVKTVDMSTKALDFDSRPASESDDTSRSLQLRDTVSIIVGVVVGTAIFRFPTLVFQNVAGPWQALGVWLLGGILCLLGALCYTELATTYPRNGGDYEYLGRAYGRWMGFLFGWAQLAVILTGSIGAMAYAFADYGVRVVSLPREATAGLAAAAILVLSAMNLLGILFGKSLQNLLSGAKILGLVAVALTVLGGGETLTILVQAYRSSRYGRRFVMANTVFCLVLSTVAAQPAAIKWRPVGPGGGGWLTALAVDSDDPSLVYLGCDVGGFYKSTNGGQTWTIMNRGLTDYYVQDILPDPEEDNTIYLGMQGGLFKSTDGGETWQWKRTGFPEPNDYRYSAPVSSLVMHPTDRQTLYAGIGRPRMNTGGKGHIYKSTDAGETWRLLDGIAKHAGDAVIHRLAIRRDDPNVLFAATDTGLFKSSDGGVTFQRKEKGLPHRFCRNVIISPSRPDVVYVVMWSTHAKEPWHGGVYRSDDGGETWVARNTGLP